MIFSLDIQAQQQSLVKQQQQQAISNELIKSYSAMSLNTNKPVTIANTSGQVILLNSWATWCLPCREEMPGLEELHQEFQSKGLSIIGISVDSSGSNNMIKSFVQRMKLTYTFWHDPNNNFARLFKTLGVPESYLVDKDGNILYQWKGPFDPVSEDTKSIISNALSTVTVNDPQQQQQQQSIVDTETKVKDKERIVNNTYTKTSETKLSDLSKIGIPLAFAAGLLSFLSPCILPLIPSYIAFITGTSSDEILNKNKKRNKNEEVNHYNKINKKNNNDDDFTSGFGDKSNIQSLRISFLKSNTFIRGSLFILGFSVVFVALGASITAIGSAFHEYSIWIERIGGIMLVIFGLNLFGLLKIPGSQREWGLKFSKRPAGHIGALLIGMGFGAGWTPCIGPILASILTVAATTGSIFEGVTLLIFYSMGLAIPFLVSAFAIDKYMIAFQRLRKWMPWIHRSSAALIIVMGLLLLTGSLAILTNSLAGMFPMFG